MQQQSSGWLPPCTKSYTAASIELGAKVKLEVLEAHELLGWSRGLETRCHRGSPEIL
jgi:hypothetical protein